jgi:3-oxosteroid 1-dehydrogenase
VPMEASHPQLKRVRESPHLDLDAQLSRFTNGRPTREAWVGGRALVGGLLIAALDAGVNVTCSAPVAEILVEDDHVVGIATEIDGEHIRVRARGGVLLNTGGFDWNAEMSRRSLVGGNAVRALTPPSLTGDGHVMAQRLGAATALMDQCMLNTGIHIPGETHDGAPLYRLFDPSLSKPHSMLVNRQGRRFANESSYYCVTQGLLEFYPRVRRYDNLPAWHISDRTFREHYGLPTVGPDDPVPEWITSADTLEELAEKLGIDAVGLLAQAEVLNASVDVGVDERFQRGESPYDRVWGDSSYVPNPTLGRIETGPFSAIEIFPASAGHRGGLVTNPAAEVLSVDGTPLAGLYACGNVAAQLMIGAAYASGVSIGSALVFGRIAAQQVARRVGFMTKARPS